MVILFLSAPYFPLIYNTTDSVRSLATSFMICYAIYLPFSSLMNSFYFAIRSGGKTLMTFLFDSGYMFVITVPFAYVLARFTGFDVVTVYMASLLIEIFKVIVGFVLVKNGFWARNIVDVKDD